MAGRPLVSGGHLLITTSKMALAARPANRAVQVRSDGWSAGEACQLFKCWIQYVAQYQPLRCDTRQISLVGGQSTPGSLPKLGWAVQVRANHVRRTKQRRGNSRGRAEGGEGEGVRGRTLLQRGKCQRPAAHIPG